MATKHTCNNGNGPVFGRKTDGCPRCEELKAGAAPVVWRHRPAPLKHEPHVCSAKCGPVCTHGDW